MNRDRFKSMVLLMRLSLPTAAWQYWQAWDHLPARMAVHFDADWRPNALTHRARVPCSCGWEFWRRWQPWYRAR
jgi:hypothetical protein